MTDPFDNPRLMLAMRMAQTTRCPACGTEQVQVVDWNAEPMRWRCRMPACRHEWAIPTVLPPLVVRELTPEDRAALAAAKADSVLVVMPDSTELLRLALRRILEVPIGTKGMAPKDRAQRLFAAVEDMRRIARDALQANPDARLPGDIP